MDTSLTAGDEEGRERQPRPWQETRSLFLDGFHRADGPLTWEAFKAFGSRAAIYRHLKRLHEEGLIEAVDRISVKGQGKPPIVWALPGYKPRRNQTGHDVRESLVIVGLGLPARRGRDVDQRRKPDWEWVLPNGEIISGELDTGAMSYRELVEDRYEKYRDSEDVVVWVSCGLWGTRDQTRLDGMRKHAAGIKDIAWFVTYGDLTEHKEKADLVNHDGEVVTFAELCRQVAYPATNPEEMSQPNTDGNAAESGEATP